MKVSSSVGQWLKDAWWKHDCAEALAGCPDPKAFVEAVKNLKKAIREAGLNKYMDIPGIPNPDEYDGWDLDFLKVPGLEWLKEVKK